MVRTYNEHTREFFILTITKKDMKVHTTQFDCTPFSIDVKELQEQDYVDALKAASEELIKSVRENIVCIWIPGGKVGYEAVRSESTSTQTSTHNSSSSMYSGRGIYPERGTYPEGGSRLMYPSVPHPRGYNPDLDPSGINPLGMPSTGYF